MPAMLKTVLSVLVAGKVAAAQQCIVPTASNQQTMEIFMPKQNFTLTVPPIPTASANYAYATDNALVAVPAACRQAFSSQLGASNFEDRQPGGPTDMYYFRVSDPNTEYAMLADMSSCACGLVILLHGSSGATWQSVSYAKMMSGMGHIVIMPDSMAMPASMGLKGMPLKATADINTTDYWASSSPYTGSCSWTSSGKPLCYSTSTENILNDVPAYQEYIERNNMVRKLELDYFVESRTAVLDAFSKITLLGRSEGAGIAAKYYHATLEPKLTGRIIASYACDFNYYSSCAAHAWCGSLPGGRCSASTPQLNIIGDTDSYFSAADSSVSKVVADAGHGGPITGTCREAYDSLSMTAGTVVVFPETGHSLISKLDNAVRSLFADFVNNPGGPSTWGSLNRAGCSLNATSNIWSCSDSGDGTLVQSSSWGSTVVNNWAMASSFGACSVSTTSRPQPPATTTTLARDPVSHAARMVPRVAAAIVAAILWV